MPWAIFEPLVMLDDFYLFGCQFKVIISSIAELHNFDAALDVASATGRHKDAAPAPTPFSLAITVGIMKKFSASCEA
jgi:hypothetical protein